MSTAAALFIAAISFLVPGERVVLAAESPRRGLASSIQVEISPLFGSVHYTTAAYGRTWAGVVAASTSVTSTTSSPGQVAIQPVEVRRRGNVLNTLALAVIMAVCLTVLATGIPDVVASLRGRKRGALERTSDGR